jgi:nucleoside-diphosphate-sugar epimerase
MASTAYSRTLTQRHLFCFGLGYSAAVLARRVLAEGWRVSGTCRDPRKAEALRREGVAVHGFDTARPLQDMEALAGVTHLLSSVPPDGTGDPAIAAHGDDIVRLGGGLQWIGYLSTTGVYGDQQGRWIDERCPPQPISEGSRQRLVAENQWLALGQRLGIPAHVFRLPGIYGPGGRSQIDALKAGRAHRIVKPGQVFNRIHVEDLAGVLLASMHARAGAPIYNVADDEPAPADEVVVHAARLLGIAPPPEIAFEAADMPPFAAHFYAECKRIRNTLIKEELGVTLRYPTYREGFAAIASSS